MAEDPSQLEVARRLIADAQHIVVLTGAGISTDSGIPDFRGPQGLWTRNPEAEKASNIHNWVSDPGLRRSAWQSRLAAVDRPAPRPNAGHRALVDLERAGRLDLIVTQNVDGLHADAGSSRARLVEIHGTSREAMCLVCGRRFPMTEVLDRVRDGENDPACAVCGGLLKSATISFGLSLVEADLDRAAAAARAADMLLAVGSTLSVYPIAGMVPIASAAGARVVIVNGGATEFDDIADAVVRGSISETLPALVR
jgi:NAD-dependent deacetylase